MTTSRFTPYLSNTPPTDRGQRILLTTVTALIAATPLVSAGDLGHVPMSTATGHFYLTAGWFTALAGWAIWNAWTKPGRRMVGVVGLGLIVTAGLVAARAVWAPNRWLAWGTAWDWMSIAAAFVVVRQIAVETEDIRGLFAVVVATGVAAIAALVPERIAAMVGWSWPAAVELDPGTTIAMDWWPTTDDSNGGLAAMWGLPSASRLVAYIGRLRAGALRSSANDPASREPSVAPGAFYVGGIVGLLVGLMLQVGDLPPRSTAAIPSLGIAAAVRGLAWFTTFASIANAAWVTRWPRATGVVALILVVGFAVLLNLLVSTVIFVWVTAAIALNLTAPPSLSPWSRSGIGRLVPLVVTIPLAIAFVLLVAYPGITAANAVWHARSAARGYPTKLKTVEQANPLMKKAARNDAAIYVDRAILRPLTQAVRANPDDAGPLLEQVPWWLAMWELGAPVKADENAIVAARAAQDRDPESVAGFIAELRVRLRFAEVSDIKRAEQFTHAEELIQEIVRRDPARAAQFATWWPASISRSRTMTKARSPPTPHFSWTPRLPAHVIGSGTTSGPKCANGSVAPRVTRMHRRGKLSNASRRFGEAFWNASPKRR